MDGTTIQLTLFGSPMLPKCCETCVSLGSDLPNGVALGCVRKLHMKGDCAEAFSTKQQEAKKRREDKAAEKAKTKKLTKRPAKKPTKKKGRK